jgi:ribosomal-protein-alanine N-acetyltransferase
MGGGAWEAAATGVTDRQVVTRLVHLPDLREVIEIERASFADPWSREAFESSIDPQRMRFLVAEDGRQDSSGERRILGYVVALLLFDEAEIANLAVAPSARRHGIGGLLLDRMSAALAGDGVESLYLDVRESNASARALYASRSFHEVGRRRGYYRHPTEDALLLKRNLVVT